MRAKRKLLISMLAIVFVLLAVVATVAIAFALTQQTITTTLNIGYVVEDIDGTASATYTIGGVTESLTAMKGDQVIGDTLVFHAGDTEDAGNLMFPEGQIPLSATNDNIVIQYTYSNTGAKHYIASMSFDSELVADNMKVEYSIDGTTYSENRYAVVVPAHSTNKSYWIKISIENKAKSASFTGDFKWLLSGCDPQADSYLSLTSVELQATGSAGQYKAYMSSEGSYVGELVFPREVNGDPVTQITTPNYLDLTAEQRNMITKVYIPDTVTDLIDDGDLGVGPFQDFENLQTVIFEQNEKGSATSQSGTGLKTIGTCSFYGCSSLKELIIPNTVTNIGGSAFGKCHNMTNLSFSGDNSTYHIAGNCLIDKSSKTILQGFTNSIIPSDGSVTQIGDGAFWECQIKSIDIPNCVTGIDGWAFAFCENLTTISIGANVAAIGANAFYECTNLKNVTTHILNDSVVVAIKGLANENGEMNLTIDTVTQIESGAFIVNESWDFPGLTSLVFEDSVSSVCTNAFGSCTDLKSIKFSKEINTIEEMFMGYANLDEIIIEEGNETYYTINNCLINKKTKTLIRGTNTSVIPTDGSVEIIGHNSFGGCVNLTEITIPDGVVSIGQAFDGCSRLAKITIPNSVTSFDGSTFRYCIALSSITLPTSLTTLGAWTFWGCTGLTSIVIPASVTTIGDGCFGDCTSLTSVVLEVTTGWINTWSGMDLGELNVETASNPESLANLLKTDTTTGYVRRS